MLKMLMFTVFVFFTMIGAVIGGTSWIIKQTLKWLRTQLDLDSRKETNRAQQEMEMRSEIREMQKAIRDLNEQIADLTISLHDRF